MGKSSAEIDRGPPQGAAEVSAKLPPAALESTLHVSCMTHPIMYTLHKTVCSVNPIQK